MTNDETTHVTERPILFSGPMVRAILDGHKTQTRRVVKPQPEEVGYGRACKVAPYCTGTKWPLAYYERRAGGCWNSSEPLRCPYGKHGERLWVKETFRTLYDPATCLPDQLDIDYAADGERIMDRVNGPDRVKWRPSIFMPRWASRLTLEIVSVRVERLQDTSEAEANAEGIRGYENNALICKRTVFAALWDSLNAKRGFGWERNPWVWVIEFRKLEAGREDARPGARRGGEAIE